MIGQREFGSSHPGMRSSCVPLNSVGVANFGGLGTGSGMAAAVGGVCALSWFCKACSWAMSAWTCSWSDMLWCSGPRLKSSSSVRGRPHSGSVRISEHWDQPCVQGTGQSQGVSKSSRSVVQAALQGLTCEKKTKSILVKEANLYSDEKMT